MFENQQLGAFRFAAQVSTGGRAAALALLLLLGFFALFDLVIATVADVRGGAVGGIVMGAVFAQITLLAAGTALAPVRLLVRVTLGLAGAALVSLAMLACVGRNSEGLVISGAAILLWLAIQAPLWVLRLAFGRRLAWPGEELSAQQDETQFGLRQLFAWTLLSAMTLGVARLTVSADNLQRIARDPQEVVAILLLLAAFGSLSAWPLIWAAFVRSWMPLWMIAAACCAAGLCFAEIIAFQTSLGVQGDLEVFWWISAIQFIASGACLLLVRWCGFRLVHAAPDARGSA